MQQAYLFEDGDFSKSRRYFWALQSLRLFAEHIDGTIRTLPILLYAIRREESSSKDHDMIKTDFKEMQKEFEDLRNRIERKRQEIQSLRDGVRLLHPLVNNSKS